MTAFSHHVFLPADGAVLDLESLQAIAEGDDRCLSACLQILGMPGIVLEGLELQGDWSPGPPGTRRPEARSEEALVSPGKALLKSRDGRVHFVQVREELRVPWPTTAGPQVRGHLVMAAELGQDTTAPSPATSSLSSSLRFARKPLRYVLGFIRPDQAATSDNTLLTLASPVGNGMDWLTDLARVMEPEHQAIRILLKRFDQLDQTIWKAEPEGSVWDRQILGRNWVRYQTVAAAALQSARMILLTSALSTRDRVRLLGGLHDQLSQSVERAANELLQSLGPAEGSGPYAIVGQRARGVAR